MISGLVAIVGRPNVGKSTLFNRLTVTDTAIVDDRPGVTRDRLYGTVWLGDERREGFAVIDTGGFETDDFKFQPFADNLVWRQTEAAIVEADLVVLLLDAKAGLNPHDEQLVRYLGAANKPHLLVVNKIDGPEQAQGMWEFFELGADDLIRVSAAHNRGVGDLKERIHAELLALPRRRSQKAAEGATRIAIIGRPNAGKSSILNRIVGEERALVSDIAGTTRDALDTPLTYNGQTYILIDTAGIRRKSRVTGRLEALSVVRSIRSIDAADVVLLVIDAVTGLAEQDARLADLAADRGKPVAIVVNKWDLVEEKDTHTAKTYAEAIHDQLRTLSYVPVCFVSALANQRVHKLLALAERLAQSSRRRVETSQVNQALRAMVAEHTPALIRGKTKRVKFYFATQVAVSPPTIVVFCNVFDEIQASYIRYMTHRFRQMLGFVDVPIRIIYRPKSDVRARDQAAAARYEAEVDGDFDADADADADSEDYGPDEGDFPRPRSQTATGIAPEA